MKYIKMLGLAAVAAMALMAIVGAGSASATVLCKNSACTETYGAGTEVKATSSHTQLTAPFGTVTCTTNEVAGKTENAGSATETVKGPVTSLVFSSCNGVVKVLANGTLEVHKTTSGNGTLTSSGAKVTTELFGVHCVWGTAAAGTNLGTVTGGSPATVDVKATVNLVEGSSFFCGSTAVWEGTYTVNSPNPLFVG